MQRVHAPYPNCMLTIHAERKTSPAQSVGCLHSLGGRGKAFRRRRPNYERAFISAYACDGLDRLARRVGPSSEAFTA